jgi:hypothetical protein
MCEILSIYLIANKSYGKKTSGPSNLEILVAVVPETVISQQSTAMTAQPPSANLYHADALQSK